ncbi:MAG TPA: ABC transporter permease [bacterium]|jgi:peptide/nickel transport system permease protein|nr:ABC transporter permease [Dictyoglomota bacterium]HHV81238.1 ABC transporter permease [bacterium]HOK29579.1 ABC transporter permease [bacterium]HOL54608.1 ABC transporter permease [bacterium]HOP55494.1 ABC transporter permease [bacterium]
MFSTIKTLFKYNKKFAFGFTVISILVFLAILSFFSPYDPKVWNLTPRDLPPSIQHPLGTTSMGQDVFWLATYAIKNSLFLSIISMFISRIIAIAVGLVAGYKGGSLDRILMTLNDSFVIIPLLPILILIASVLKGGLNIVNLGILLGFFGWAWDARVIRSQILSLREREFTYTARLSGMKTSSIILKEYLPFIVPLIMATAMNNMLWAIGMEVTLAILGLSSLEIPTLGTMIHWSVNSQSLLLGIWWWILTPVIICIFLFISLYMLSVSISEFLDPRSRLKRIEVMKE